MFTCISSHRRRRYDVGASRQNGHLAFNAVHLIIIHIKTKSVTIHYIQSITIFEISCPTLLQIHFEKINKLSYMETIIDLLQIKC